MSFPQPSSICVVWVSTPNHKISYSVPTNYENRLSYTLDGFWGWLSHMWHKIRPTCRNPHHQLFSTHRANPPQRRSSSAPKREGRAGSLERRGPQRRNVGSGLPRSVGSAPDLEQADARLDWELVEVNGAREVLRRAAPVPCPPLPEPLDPCWASVPASGASGCPGPVQGHRWMARKRGWEAAALRRILVSPG
jgi:hypothetical protein